MSAAQAPLCVPLARSKGSTLGVPRGHCLPPASGHFCTWPLPEGALAQRQAGAEPRQACGRPGGAMCSSCMLPCVGAQPQVVPVRPCEADGLCLVSCVICSQL